ncbi:hypothetical protein B0H11DRAFT_2347342 [Mycena galericulata]|nr:hypothetical protein B0H11DRAFT_2347342 [Mycena galericulata]
MSAPPTPSTREFTRGRIAELDSEIAALKISLTRLKLERKTLRGQLDEYVYPVLTLPNEIVSEIFLQRIDSCGGSTSNPASPLFLGHICHKWREIAVSTPSLWTTISLTLADITSPDSRLRLLEIWLARSRDCPLSISLIDDGPWPDAVSIANQFVAAIVPHCRRWHALQLKMRFRDFLQIQGELPLLRELFICPLDPDITQISGGPSQIFQWAPKLEMLILNSAINLDTFKFPWHQLMFLHVMEGGSLQDLVQILRTAVNLTHLGAQHVYSQDDTVIDLPPISPLPHLGTLAIGRFAHPSINLHRQLLDLLTLPALTHLEIVESLLPAVEGLITRSQCPLDALYICVDDTEYCAIRSAEGKITLEVCDEVTSASGSEGESAAEDEDEENSYESAEAPGDEEVADE